MGQGVQCTVRLRRRVSEGRAQLETDALVFQGDAFDLDIPIKDIREVTARRGQLSVKFPGGVATFDLGSLAEKWALKIRYPKSLLDKLGVKPDSQVAVLGVRDDVFRKQLRARAAHVSEGRLRKDLDLIFFAADSHADLKKLGRMKASIKRDGAIWVVSLKGKQARLRDVDVIAAAIEAGLVDTKVVGFSETHTSLKLVIPVARR